MARDLLQIHRGNFSSIPSLTQGEFGYALDKKALYIGGISGNEKIGGSDYYINLVDFGVVGDGVTDNTLALQNAINEAISSKKTLFIPAGDYGVNSKLTINGRISIIGEGEYSSIIRALQPMTALIEFSDTPINACYFHNLNVSGNNNADIGIKATQLSDTMFSSVRVTSTLTKAISVGSGWSNTYFDCMIHANQGNGLQLEGSSNNSVNIIATQIFNNDGIGLFIRSGRNVNVNNCVIENNKITGIFHSFGVNPLTISECYFEANGETGYVFSNPSKTIKTDVIVNGGTSLINMDYSFPCDVTIKNCSHQPNATATCCYYLSGVKSATIEGNSNTLNDIPMIGCTVAQGLTRVDNLRLKNNTFNGDEFIIDGFGDNNVFTVHNWLKELVNGVNYISNNPLNWSVQLGGVSSSVTKSNLKFKGKECLMIEANANGLTNYFGESIDMVDYPELHGKFYKFSAWVKQEYSGSGGSTLYTSGSGNSHFYPSGVSDWKQLSIIGKFPTSGVVKFGVAIYNGLSGDRLHVFNPTVGLLGLNIHDFENTGVRYEDTTAPTIGTWEKGDIIYNENVVAGGSIGWVCTATGTPGTWKTFGNVSV